MECRKFDFETNEGKVMGMKLTKEFVNSCRKVGVLRDFLCQAIDQVDEKDKEIAELEDERRWRKFPDEKPTKDIKFLVINEKGFLQCCYYSPILHEFQIPVAHWMPLPSAPKEEK